MISALASFFSAFVIAFVKQWVFAFILCCIVPAIIAIFVVGGGFIAKYATLAMKEYGNASNIAEEIISSVRTVQAFGTQDKLAKLYDENLVGAQRAGYRQQAAGAIMLAVMFFCVYAFYGLGFCNAQGNSRLTSRGRRPINCVRRHKHRNRPHSIVCRYYWRVFSWITWAPSGGFRKGTGGCSKDLPDLGTNSDHRQPCRLW